MELSELIDHATEFSWRHPEHPDDYVVSVVLHDRERGLWAVRWAGTVLDKELDWLHDSKALQQNPELRATVEYPFTYAVALAERVVAENLWNVKPTVDA